MMRLRALEEGGSHQHHGNRGASSSSSNRSNRHDAAAVQRLTPKWVILLFAAMLGLFIIVSRGGGGEEGEAALMTEPEAGATFLFKLEPNEAWEGQPCADIWRPELLEGKCFGLEKTANDTLTWEACRALCCWQADCVTWQFQEGRGCYVGGPVRLGFEAAETGNWCEPTAPKAWKGKRIDKRAEDGTCKWKEELPYQCFGLGPEKTLATDAAGEEKKRLTQKLCQEGCCKDENCQVWQWRDDKGCFFGKEGHCEKDNKPFIGGRKCVPHFCGDDVPKKGDAEPDIEVATQGPEAVVAAEESKAVAVAPARQEER